MYVYNIIEVMHDFEKDEYGSITSTLTTEVLNLMLIVVFGKERLNAEIEIMHDGTHGVMSWKIKVPCVCTRKNKRMYCTIN